MSKWDSLVHFSARKQIPERGMYRGRGEGEGEEIPERGMYRIRTVFILPLTELRNHS